MDFADFVCRIGFRYLKPNTARPRGFRRLTRWLGRFGWQFEIANTTLPEGSDEARRLLKPLCRLPRMSTFAIGAIINRAVAELDASQSFVNVGVWHGFTFFSGLAGNAAKRCIGVDDFSHRGSPREKFLSRLERWGSDSHTFHEVGFREYFQNVHTGSIGAYVFDGPHTREDHRDALELAEPYFADGCIVVMDDTNWSQVREATEEFIEQSPRTYETLLDVRTPGTGHPTFWNGVMVLRVGAQPAERAELRQPQDSTQRVCEDVS